MRLDHPRNLVKVIHDGIDAQKFNGFERMQAMPSFADKLSSAEIAELVNFLRQSWGGLDAIIDAAAVDELTGNSE